MHDVAWRNPHGTSSRRGIINQVSAPIEKSALVIRQGTIKKTTFLLATLYRVLSSCHRGQNDYSLTPW